MLNFLSLIFFITGFALAYWFWIRPLLAGRPSVADFYNRTESWWRAIGLKLTTIKTKLSAILLMTASGLVSLHDFLIPVITGIDWTAVTSKVPAWVWPLVSFAVGALFLWLRTLTGRTQDRALDAIAAGATVAEAKVQAGISGEETA